MNMFRHRVQHYLARHIAQLVYIAQLDDQKHHDEMLRRRLRHCGQNVRFNGRVDITFPERTELGDNVHIGDNAFLSTVGSLAIMDNCHIGRNFVVYTANHQYEGERLPYDDQRILKPVTIGKNVWIGANVVVVPGISIGDGAVIGAGAVVNNDIPALAVAGCQQIRILKYRDKDRYDQLEEGALYGGIDGKPLNGPVSARY